MIMDGVLVLDVEGRVVTANPAAGRMLGQRPSDLAGKLAADILGDQIAAPPTIDDEGGERRFELSLGEGTSQCSYHVLSSPLGLWAGVDIGRMLVLRDVSGRKKADRAMQIQSHAIEHAGVGVLRLDDRGSIREVNGYICRLLGFSHSELLNMTVSDVTVGLETSTWPQRWQELKEAGPVTFEKQYRTKDDRIIPVEISSSIVEFEGEQHDLGFVRDITERKRLEDRLFQEEERFRALIENSSDLITVVDRRGIGQFQSPSCWRTMGYRPEELEGKNAFDLVHPDDVSRIQQAFAELQRGTEDSYGPVEVRSRHKDGSWRTLEIVGRKLDRSASEPTYILNSRDVTDRKRIEHAWQQSHNLLAKLSARVPGMIYQFQLHADGRVRIPWTSPAISDVFELTPQEVCADASPVYGRLHPDDHDRVVNLIRESARTLEAFHVEYRVVLPRQGVRWHLSDAVPELTKDGSLLWHGIILDVTERKQVQEVLRESEKRYRQLIEASHDWVWEIDENGTYTFASAKVFTILGYEPGEVVGKTPFDFMPPDDARQFAALLGPIISTRSPFSDLQSISLHKDGHAVAVESTGSPIFDDNGDLRGYRGMDRDITKRRETEQALKASQSQLAEAMGLADLVNWEFDVDTGIFTFNDRFYALYGTTAALEGGYQMPADVYANTFVHPDEQSLVAQEVNRAIQSTDPNYRSYVEHRIIRRDGEIRHVVVRFGITKDERGRTIKTHGANQDITKRKRAEKEKEDLQTQLLQAQKMETVGRLAGGIAHDFNNLLTAIIGNSSLALAAMAPEDPNRELVADIKDAGERAAGLTSQILAYSRRQMLRPQNLLLNECIVGMEPLLRRTLGEDIALHFVLAPDLHQTEVDRHQMGQVLMNLVVNARDAMPVGGNLTIETANVRLDAAYSEINPEVEPGGYVMLAVTDTGCGMDSETMSQIFEPFFTTKEVGKGTGLGLSTVFGIVKQSGGSISVYSEPGQGSAFRIYLPTHEAASSPKTESSLEEEQKEGAETILVVEDEVPVRELITRILSCAGYKVLRVGSVHGVNALLVDGAPIPSLLLTDVVLPGGASGREVADMLVSRYPDLRVIFMSGFTRDSVVHNGRLDEDIEFLEKPFTPEALLRSVRGVLDVGTTEVTEAARSGPA
jgi:two-component system cell cycle sensor histidine kinase/response regulator CckA